MSLCLQNGNMEGHNVTLSSSPVPILEGTSEREREGGKVAHKEQICDKVSYLEICIFFNSAPAQGSIIVSMKCPQLCESKCIGVPVAAILLQQFERRICESAINTIMLLEFLELKRAWSPCQLFVQVVQLPCWLFWWFAEQLCGFVVPSMSHEKKHALFQNNKGMLFWWSSLKCSPKISKTANMTNNINWRQQHNPLLYRIIGTLRERKLLFRCQGF